MIETKEYLVPLTDAELLTAADIVGMISAKIREKEDAFAAARKEYQENIKNLKRCMAEQMKKLTTKREVREATLRIEFNRPEEGKKQIFDFTTGELYETADMTDDDWQNIFVASEIKNQSEPSDQSKESEPSDQSKESEPSDQSKESEPSDQLEELEESELSGESEKTLDKCSVCGSCANIYHVNYGKTICRKCMFEMPQEKRVKEMLDSGHPFLFRATAGYGNMAQNNDTTNFRFIDKSPEAQPKEPWKTRSWGMGIWRPGDYRKEGSEAYNFYMLLCCNPNGQEN